MSLFNELKRRNVIRVAVAYIVASWVVAQVAELILETTAAPPWVMQVLLLLLAIGFVFAVIFSWAFELTPEGLKREHEVQRDDSITHVTAKKLDIVTIGLVLLAIGLLAADRYLGPPANEATVAQQPGSAEPSEPVLDDRSIAVLPFRDMSPEGDQAWFGEGIAEELLNALVKVEGLRVASRTSAFSLADDGLSLPEIAAELNVNHVLEGSVRTGGDRMRVTAQLIEVESDTHLWSETYDRDTDDVLAVQDEIARHVASELQSRLGSAESQVPASVTDTLTDNPVAYQHYIRGRHFWRKRSIDDLVRAAEALEAAVELDPEFAAAWANLSVTYSNMPEYGDRREYPRALYYERANQAARQALLLNPSLGEARAILANQMYRTCDPAGAARAYQAAIEIDPDDPTLPHWLALALNTYGLSSLALPYAEEAYRLDPLNAAVVSTVGDAYASGGDIETALEYMREAQTLGIYDGSSIWVGLTLAMTGDLEGARELLNEDGSFSGNETTEWVDPWIAALKSPDNVAEFEAFIEELVATGELSGTDVTSGTLSPLGSPLFFEIKRADACLMHWVDYNLFAPWSKELRELPEFREWLDYSNARELYAEFRWPDVCQGDDPEAWCFQ